MEMLGFIFGCVTITNSTYSLLNRSLVIDYEVDLTQDCSFFEVNEVSAFLFSIRDMATGMSLHQTFQTEKIEMMHRQHNTIVYQISKVQNVAPDIRQGFLIFEFNGIARQVTIPFISAVIPYDDLVEISSFKITRNISAYRIYITYTIEEFSPNDDYELAEVIVFDEYKLSDYFERTTMLEEVINHSSDKGPPIYNISVRFQDLPEAAFEAGEIFAKLEAVVSTSLTFVYKSVDQQDAVLIRKTGTYVDESLGSMFDLPQLEVFYNKVGLQLAMIAHSGLESLIVSIRICHIRNSSDVQMFSEYNYTGSLNDNSTTMQIFVGFGSYMLNDSYRREIRKYKTIYDHIVSTNEWDNEYEFDLSIQIINNNGAMQQKEWPNINYSTYNYEIRDIIVSHDSIDMLICSHNDFEKREELQLSLYYTLSDDYRSMTTTSNFSFSGVQFVKEASISINCSRFSFREENFIIQEDFVMHATRKEYSFTEVMKAIYKERFTAIGQNESKLVHYVFQIIDEPFVYYATNYMFDSSVNILTAGVIFLSFFMVQIIFISLWHWIEKMRKPRVHFNRHRAAATNKGV